MLCISIVQKLGKKSEVGKGSVMHLKTELMCYNNNVRRSDLGHTSDIPDIDL